MLLATLGGSTWLRSRTKIKILKPNGLARYTNLYKYHKFK